MHTLEMRALQECLREAESGEGETMQNVCYQIAMLQIFNSVLFNTGCAEKKNMLRTILTVPAFSAKLQGCGIFRTYSGRFKGLELGTSVIL